MCEGLSETRSAGLQPADVLVTCEARVAKVRSVCESDCTLSGATDVWYYGDRRGVRLAVVAGRQRINDQDDHT
jgi:hypothetical protein